MDTQTTYGIEFWKELERMDFGFHTHLKRFLSKKNTKFFFGEWEQIGTNAYSHRLNNGNSYQVRFKRFTIYKNEKGSRLRDPKRTKTMCYIEVIFFIGDKPDYPPVEALSKSVTGEGSEKMATIRLQQDKIRKFAKETMGISTVIWSQ